MNDMIKIIDLSNYRDRVGARVTPGRHRVRVDHIEPKKSKAGNDMLVLELGIIGGEFDGQTLIDRLTLSEAAMFRVVAFMQAIGLATPKKRLQVNIGSWIGKVLEVDVEDGEPYNNVVKSEVRQYIRIAKSAESASDDLESLLPSEDAEAPQQAAQQAEESVSVDATEVDLEDLQL